MVDCQCILADNGSLSGLPALHLPGLSRLHDQRSRGDYRLGLGCYIDFRISICLVHVADGKDFHLQAPPQAQLEILIPISKQNPAEKALCQLLAL